MDSQRWYTYQNRAVLVICAVGIVLVAVGVLR